MRSSFSPGQLVTAKAWLDDDIELYDRPPGSKTASSNARIIGRLVPADVAVVVALGRADGSKLYVLGPRGGGWTFGAYLQLVDGTS